MKFICQKHYPEIPYITRTEQDEEKREIGRKTTIKSSGCGLCATIMALDRLLVNYEFTLEDAIKLSYETKANYGAGTSLKRYAPAFAQRFNLRYENTDDFERVLDCLRTGGAVVVLVGGDREGRVGVFSHIQHYITIIGIEEDGRLAILDPAYEEGRYMEEGRVGKVEVKNGVIAIADINVIKEDCVNLSMPYYLFWRK